MIDVTLPEDGRAAEVLAAQLIAELDEPDDAPVVAYRGAHRWLQSFASAPLAAAPVGAALRPRGVYVITGGLGGLGLVIARHLAETMQARLVLIGRSALPPREAWGPWLESHPDDDATAARIRAVQAIETAGGEVLPLSADVADRPGLGRALDEARRRFGQIHGVVHAAGIAGGGIIALKTPEIADRVLESKVQGTLALWDMRGGREMDFIFRG